MILGGAIWRRMKKTAAYCAPRNDTVEVNMGTLLLLVSFLPDVLTNRHVERQRAGCAVSVAPLALAGMKKNQMYSLAYPAVEPYVHLGATVPLTWTITSLRLASKPLVQFPALRIVTLLRLLNSSRVNIGSCRTVVE